MKKNDKYILIRFCGDGGFFIREAPTGDVPMTALIKDRKAWQRVNSYADLKMVFLDLIDDREG